MRGRLGISALVALGLASPAPVLGATRRGILDTATRTADRLAAVKPVARGWEDVPYLVGSLLVAEELESLSQLSGRRFVDRALLAVGDGNSWIRSGDYTAYAQAALDLYRLELDEARKRALLTATEEPLTFATRALRASPAEDPPADPWWVDGGYGTRFWVDDLFSLVPWLAMRGSRRDGLPADPVARDLAYEWIESYLHDHRPDTADSRAAHVPTLPAATGPLLWDPRLELFRHDPGSGAASFWGRGNGWAAWGLARSARYLDAPYGGGRYVQVVDRTGIRETLTRQAGALASRRAPDGGWPTDLADSRACPVSETSATGLITHMLARGVNEGWLDRQVYVPVVLKAFALLLGRVDDDGDVSGIQPPGTGPDCTVTDSDDPAVNVSYGVGAFLLAASEIARFPDADLAGLEAAAREPVDAALLVRTWLVALQAAGTDAAILLTNPGPGVGHVLLESDGRPPGSPTTLDIPAGGSALARVTVGPPHGAASVITVRADTDLAVRPRNLRGRVQWGDGEFSRAEDLLRGAAAAVPLWTALAEGEETTIARARDELVVLGGKNPSPAPARCAVEILGEGDQVVERLELGLDPGQADFEVRFVKAGWKLRLVNESGGVVVPFVFPGREM